jgi:hypothetical protein
MCTCSLRYSCLLLDIGSENRTRVFVFSRAIAAVYFYYLTSEAKQAIECTEGAYILYAIISCSWMLDQTTEFACSSSGGRLQQSTFTTCPVQPSRKYNIEKVQIRYSCLLLDVGSENRIRVFVSRRAIACLLLLPDQ